MTKGTETEETVLGQICPFLRRGLILKKNLTHTSLAENVAIMKIKITFIIFKEKKVLFSFTPQLQACKMPFLFLLVDPSFS